MKKFPLYFLLLLVFSCQSCQLFDKEADTIDPQEELAKLPPITATGENTFGCLVNGRAFLPKQGFLGANALDGYINKGNTFALQAINVNESYNLTIYEQRMDIGSASIILGDINCDLICDEVNFRHNDVKYDIVSNGIIEFHLIDTINSIMAGTFDIILLEKENNQKIELTEGRFDIKF
ncbi:hypothetical protein [Marivirga sp.]|uniref:hypothetical protein n=1 Tax=Marivirga sp. TaxID=2018662 RepID=UPI0025EC1254|nr:hypothetical protein [Marivirga sp.]